MESVGLFFNVDIWYDDLINDLSTTAATWHVTIDTISSGRQFALELTVDDVLDAFFQLSCQKEARPLPEMASS